MRIAHKVGGGVRNGQEGQWVIVNVRLAPPCVDTDRPECGGAPQTGPHALESATPQARLDTFMNIPGVNSRRDSGAKTDHRHHHQKSKQLSNREI